MSEIEKLALIVASMCHDLDHRGTNNSFQTKYSICFVKLLLRVNIVDIHSEWIRSFVRLSGFNSKNILDNQYLISRI